MIEHRMETMGTNEDVMTLEGALLDGELADMVDMVLSRTSSGDYRVAKRDGATVFRRHVDGDGEGDATATIRYEVASIQGNDPLADQDRGHLGSLDDERTAAEQRSGPPSYPNAFESISQMFDSPDAPDLFVGRTPAYDPVGHIGQHGSLSLIQSRALLIGSGAGIRSGASGSGVERTVDVAPTIARLLGVEPRADGTYLHGQDGVVMEHLLDGRTARHVVVLLLDGCNTNLLTEVMSAGDAPNLAGLCGTGSFLPEGMVASLPTATLANHTAEITGRHPGHSGVLHHTWMKRDTGKIPDLLSFEEMFWSSDYLSMGTETIFEVISRQRSGAHTVATFEYCDRGASMSSFGLVRGGDTSGLPDISEVSHADPMGWTASAEYGFLSQVDHLSLAHTLDAWRRTDGNALPTLTWSSFAVTDGAGHTSGPHGELARLAIMDTDKRVGEMLAEVDAAGAFDQTAFLVISDHGMEQADPNTTGNWNDHLVGTGIDYTDVGEGLIYLR